MLSSRVLLSRGFYSEPLLPLNPDTVGKVHLEGGTFLGSSRGGFELEKILECFQLNKLNQVYVIGGDGTHRGAMVLAEGRRWSLIGSGSSRDVTLGWSRCSCGWHRSCHRVRSQNY